MMRLRGGSKGGIKFTGADGETISVRDDGRISKAGQVGIALSSSHPGSHRRRARAR